MNYKAWISLIESNFYSFPASSFLLWHSNGATLNDSQFKTASVYPLLAPVSKSLCLLSVKGFHKPYACKAHLHISSSGMHHILFWFIYLYIYIYIYVERERERESRLSLEKLAVSSYQLGRIIKDNKTAVSLSTKLMCTYPQMTQPNQLLHAAKDPSVNVALKSLNVCAEKCGIWIFKCWRLIRCQLFSLWREFYLFIYSILVLISVKNKFSLHPLHCKNTWRKKNDVEQLHFVGTDV